MMRMLLIAFAVCGAFAQNAEFEVASVKRAVNAPPGAQIALPASVAETIGFEGGPGSKTPGRIRYSGVSLKMILMRAYGLPPNQITGPGWMDTERYDVEARYPAETKPEDFRLMLQRLVADRFQMAAHREIREASRYRLVIAKGGPKLSPPKELPKYKDDKERNAAM